jgi:hypothetical protein
VFEFPLGRIVDTGMACRHRLPSFGRTISWPMMRGYGVAGYSAWAARKLGGGTGSSNPASSSGESDANWPTTGAGGGSAGRCRYE